MSRAGMNCSIQVPSHPFHLSFHPEEQLLATATVSGHIYFAAFDLENSGNGVSLHKYKAHRLSARVVEFNKSGTLLSAGADGKVVLSDLNPKKIWSSQTNATPINCATFLETSVIITGDDGGCISLFDTRAGKLPVISFNEQSDYITGLLIPASVNDHQVIATSADATLAVYDLRRPQKASSGLIALSDAQEHELTCVTQLSPVTTRSVGSMAGAILTADTQGVIGVWKKDFYGDVRDRVTILADGDALDHMHSLPDGRLLVAAGATVRSLQLYPHVQEGIVAHHQGEIEALAVDHDLGILASADGEGLVKLSRLPGKLSKARKDQGAKITNSKTVEKMDFFQDLD